MVRVEVMIPRRQRCESPCFSIIEFFPINSTDEVGHELTTNLNSLDMKNLFAVAPLTTTVGDPMSFVLKMWPCFLILGWKKFSNS